MSTNLIYSKEVEVLQELDWKNNGDVNFLKSCLSSYFFWFFLLSNLFILSFYHSTFIFILQQLIFLMCQKKWEKLIKKVWFWFFGLQNKSVNITTYVLLRKFPILGFDKNKSYSQWFVGAFNGHWFFDIFSFFTQLSFLKMILTCFTT